MSDGEGSRRGLVAADWLAARDDDDRVDIVKAVLGLVAEAGPNLTAEVLRSIELTARARYGGRRFYIAKTTAADCRQARSRARPLLR